MAVDSSLLLWMYEKMLRIRIFEERMIVEFAKGEMPGFIHTYIGEEAVAVGVCAALKNDDYITSNHRGHGHIIAKDGDLKLITAELFGRATGYCKGKGGSMHVADLELGILGANGIVGGGIPIAGGAALAAKYKGSGQVAVSFFGDGAADIGFFHESLNLASMLKVPAIFVCENNGWAEYTPTHRHSMVETIADRAASYAMPGVVVDGNDMIAMYEAAKTAVDRAREGGGPTLIEAKTYRIRGHSEGDPALYRSKEEVEYWKGKDPIPRAHQYLLENGIATEAQLAEFRANIMALMDEAVAFAKASPWPEPEEALDDVYTTLKVEGR